MTSNEEDLQQQLIRQGFATTAETVEQLKVEDQTPDIKPN